MILDNESQRFVSNRVKRPFRLGVIEYNVQGQSEFEGAFIATSERLIMNVDMNGQFYYRNIPYNEIEEIHFDGTDIVFTFNIGKVPMKTKDVKAFVDYVESKIK